MKNGQSLEIPLGQQYQVGSLNWYATCTQDIKSIVITNPAHATKEIKRWIDHLNEIYQNGL